MTQTSVLTHVLRLRSLFPTSTSVTSAAAATSVAAVPVPAVDAVVTSTTTTTSVLLSPRSSHHNPDVSSLACGMCWPYSCSCDGVIMKLAQRATVTQRRVIPTIEHTQNTDTDISPSHSSKAFLKPLNLGVAKARMLASKLTPKLTRTNIEAVKEQRRREGEHTATCTAGTTVSTAECDSRICRKCHHHLPSSSSTSVTSNAANTCRGCHVFRPSELVRHDREGDLWIAVSGKVYDLTTWGRHHPGGILPLLDVAGTECTDVFRVFHSAEVAARKLPPFQIGMLGEFSADGKFINESVWTETELQKDFYAMNAQLERDGMYETRMSYYYSKIVWQIMSLAVTIGFLVAAHAYPAWRLSLVVASAASLGMFWQQLAFLGHDLGHNSVRGLQHGGAKADWLPGLVVTAFFGVSVQWWKRNHNVHHVVTNSVEHDPDIQHLPVFSISPLAFKGYYSSYFEKNFVFDNFSQWMVAHQHILYLPIMFIARLNLCVQSVILALDYTKHVYARTWEQAALAIYWAWFMGMLMFGVPGDWFSVQGVAARTAFVLVSHMFAGIVHIQITLSHFAMEVIEGRGYTESQDAANKEHFLRSQFATSMDVDCSPLFDWFHGGLQFQVAHHLLPRVPRHNLRTLREQYLKPLARKHGLDYQSESFMDAIVRVSSNSRHTEHRKICMTQHIGVR